MRTNLLASIAGVATVGALAVSTVVAGGAAAAAGGHPSKDDDVHSRSQAWQDKVLLLTNQHRAAHGLAPLVASSCADRFAEPWTDHMAADQVLEHQDLSPMLGCPNTTSAGENIACGYTSARALVSAWMHSPGHRANILNPDYDRLAVAGWVSSQGMTYATQDFLG